MSTPRMTVRGQADARVEVVAPQSQEPPSGPALAACECDASTLYEQFQQLFRHLDEAHAAGCPHARE